jgi:two-component system, cell cycle sensor histidine kinase and response regulator CckA
MGPFLLFHVALIGFFVCAGLYATWTWWLSREQRALLIFATQCLICALLTASYVAIASAADAAAAHRALTGRFVFGLLSIAVTAVLVTRLTGLTGPAARFYIRGLSVFAVGMSVAYLALSAGPPAGFSITRLTLPWGEQVSVPSWREVRWWFAPPYVAVLSVNVFALAGAFHLAPRDRLGALLVALAASSGLATTGWSLASDVLHIRVPYLGNVPFALWVIFSALQLSRSYARLVEQHRDSESQFRSLFEGLDVGVVLQDASERILVSNPAAAEMLGLTDAQLRGSGPHDPGWKLIREDGTDYPMDEVPSVVAARTRRPVRNAILGAMNRQTRARVWLQVTATPHMNADGSLLHVVVTIVDVTTRTLAEEALRQSERRLALATTNDAIWEWNSRTGDMYYSPRWFEMLGYAPTLPMTLETWLSLCHPDDLKPTLDMVNATLESPGATGYEVECRMRCADGSWRWILSRGNVIERDADGRVVLLAGTNKDITARKEQDARRHELEAQLARSQRMESMGRLAGGIAHDFNNLLTVINGYTDLLLTTRRLDGPTREMLDDIRSAGERAAALTRQLLTFSRHQVVVPDILDLNATVSDTRRMLERLIGEHIALRTALPQTPFWVRADAGQLGQVVVNLAVNARDAMPSGGTLTVSTSLVDFDEEACRHLSADARPGRYAVLAVSDTGTGIPEELHGVLFEPFFTTKGPGQGTGLGLATVHGIAKQYGGFITVSSTPGTGSVFSLYLPESGAPEVAQPHPGASSTPHGSVRTVLLAEDDDAVRPVVQSMLTHLGYHVLATSGGDAALRTAGDHPGPIDLLLTDIIMPGLSGPQLAQRLARIRPGVPVLYMSGYANDALVRDVLAHGDASYIQKPFDPGTLARKVQQAMEMPPSHKV